MSYGRLYLLGDSAHIIPPMGAKGMNLALFDAEVFAAAVRDFTATGDDSALHAYSGTCLARTWRYQEYSNWLAEMVHGASGSPVGGGGSFRERDHQRDAASLSPPDGVRALSRNRGRARAPARLRIFLREWVHGARGRGGA